jgi:hypothetical protein
MPTYVQAAGSDTWHWCRNCSSYPRTYAKSEFHSKKERPRSGGLCDQCEGKERNDDCTLNSGALAGTGSFRT